MRICVKIGDVLEYEADVLISTANPWLNLSGGVNGAILSKCGSSIQEELHSHLKHLGLAAVPAGTVVRSSPGTLPFRHILHAVAIDPFYDSSVELVRATWATVFSKAIELEANTISSPTLATGYGPLSIEETAQALVPLVDDDRFMRLFLTLVVRTPEAADILSVAFD